METNSNIPERNTIIKKYIRLLIMWNILGSTIYKSTPKSGYASHGISGKYNHQFCPKKKAKTYVIGPDTETVSRKFPLKKTKSIIRKYNSGLFFTIDLITPIIIILNPG